MTVDESDKDAAHDQLVNLLAERAQTSSPDQRAKLDVQVASAAATLGLTADEVASLSPQTIAAERRPSDLVGRFRIYRQARENMPFIFGLLLMPAIAGLGAPEVAVAGAAVLIAAWTARRRSRVAVFDISESGRLDLARHGAIDWPMVAELAFRYRHPWLSNARERVTSTTAIVRIQLRDGRSIRLAQGQLFQIRPVRRPVGLNRLARFLRNQAEAAGLRIEKLPGTPGAWRATR